jgi:hypothetical protein
VAYHLRFANRVSKQVTIVVLLATAIAAMLATSAPAVASSGISVFVGYADSLRADATSFPTPWQGAPRTTFEGCAPAAACVYDAGAVRVVNNSSGTVVVNAIAVHIDTCTYTGWPSATLTPGADLIVTQLTSGETSGCTATPAEMDTSDVGPGGSGYAGHCTPDGILPTVDVTINGTTTSYTDSGQVLNTGGIDAGVCTGNESIQWTVIGHAPCRGSLLSLTPPAQTRPLYVTATVTATFTNSCGQPLSDTLVQFTTTAGPNAGLTGSGITDANGNATFTYSSTRTGTDTLRASVSNLAGNILSNTVTVTWIMFAPGGGAFVIGDLENSNGAHVLFWGAQWWKKDHMTGGLSPASFKGFENGNRSPWCGQTWTTRPGNSSKPPSTIPAVMAVIVSSHITKSGPTISGNIVEIVLVRTDRGYGPNPGHAGTGTIIARVC